MSVAVFTLLKPYDPAKFPAVTRELDRVASRLAARSGRPLAKKETVTVAGRRVRAYTYGTTRIAFVLDRKTEYQLLCERAAAAACDLLFRTFALA
ncbi:MAG TPA: hypothetical protein VFA56_03900 [Gaiellaceae bacterium]|nr:hypothetical protein [Gaiellaceae bacterium]